MRLILKFFLDEGLVPGPAVFWWDVRVGSWDLQPVPFLKDWTGARRTRSTPVAACDVCFKR